MKSYYVKKIQSNNKTSIPWDDANGLDDFTYPWDKEQAPKTFFRALWDEVSLHFRFDVEDKKICASPIKKNKQELNYADRVEMFFTTDEQLNPYYCLEMDSLGQVMDFKAAYPKQFDFSWQWPGLLLQAQLSEQGYQVSGKIPLTSLKSLNLLKNQRLLAGLYRANCVIPGDLTTGFQWISWVNPQTPDPDFHLPGSFGQLKLI